MSHFTAIVITNNTHTKGKRKAKELASLDAEAAIESLLAPFDENEPTPESKWDWYEIGGRWEGELVEGYNAKNDIRNYEKCTYCKGTGLRDDGIGKNTRAKNPDYGCNGCHLTYSEGKAAKLPNGKPALGMKRKFGNAPTGTNVAFMKDIAKDFKPFAFVTPHYEWVERASMGWWAQTKDDNGEYEKQWEDARKTYGDHKAALVDCHI